MKISSPPPGHEDGPYGVAGGRGDLLILDSSLL